MYTLFLLYIYIYIYKIGDREKDRKDYMDMKMHDKWISGR